MTDTLMDLVDANATTGPWPFRRLPGETPGRLWQRLARYGVRQALVASNRAVLYKDCGVANNLLARALRRYAGRLYMVATVNPGFPGWAKDAEEALALGALAVRLLPGYHDYRLANSIARSYLHFAKERQVRTVVPFRLEDERHHHWLCRVPPVPVQDVANFVDQAESPVLVTNGRIGDLRQLHELVGERENLYVDLSYVNGPDGAVEELVERFGVRHVLFGTWAPFLYVFPKVEQLRVADLDEDSRRRIASVNCRELFALAEPVAEENSASTV